MGVFVPVPETERGETWGSTSVVVCDLFVHNLIKMIWVNFVKLKLNETMF